MSLYDDEFGDFVVKYWNENGKDVATVYQHGREVLTLNVDSAADLADLATTVSERLSGEEDVA